jgi:hypothetical protein
VLTSFHLGQGYITPSGLHDPSPKATIKEQIAFEDSILEPNIAVKPHVNLDSNIALIGFDLQACEVGIYPFLRKGVKIADLVNGHIESDTATEIHNGIKTYVSDLECVTDGLQNPSQIKKIASSGSSFWNKVVESARNNPSDYPTLKDISGDSTIRDGKIYSSRPLQNGILLGGHTTTGVESLSKIKELILESNRWVDTDEALNAVRKAIKKYKKTLKQQKEIRSDVASLIFLRRYMDAQDIMQLLLLLPINYSA